ncbi:MAG: hypothetical protein LBT80_07575 [Lactobacillaceae bacterium]|jgi:uncharacterized membrane protein YhaH (DUF805 family)|nr:hypothetical protein [Lactobacillaceae bacterium]
MTSNDLKEYIPNEQEFDKVRQLYADAVEQAKKTFSNLKRIQNETRMITVIFIMIIVYLIYNNIQLFRAGEYFTFSIYIILMVLLILAGITFKRRIDRLFNGPSKFVPQNVRFMTNPDALLLNVLVTQLIKTDDYLIYRYKTGNWAQSSNFIVLRREDNPDKYKQSPVWFQSIFENTTKFDWSKHMIYIDTDKL